MSNGVSTVTLDRLIQAALTGQPYNQQRLGAEAERYSLRLSRAKAPDLPEDLHDEVCLEAFVELLKLDASALAKHSGRILFRRAVLAAIRSVRASYAPPGERTRSPGPTHRNDRPAVRKIAPEDVGAIVDAEMMERSTITEGAFSYVDFDRLPDPRQATEAKRVEDRIEADGILRDAPHEVSRALRLIHLSDKTLAHAASQVGVSRFVLTRRIEAFCTGWQAAA